MATQADSGWHFLGVGAANAAFRGLSLVIRFLLILGLVRWMAPDEVGLWGVFTSANALALQAVGLEFYTFSTRELLGVPRERWPCMLRDQLVLHALVYALALPALVVALPRSVVPWASLPFFLALLVLEHLSQECSRLLVVIGRPLRSTGVLFLRTAVWVGPALAFVRLAPGPRPLVPVFACWTAGVALSLLLACFFLRDLPWRNAWREPVDRRWIARGVRTALPLLGSSFAVRAMTSADRFMVQHYLGNAAAGVYTFFSGIVNAVQVALEAGVTALLFPPLVGAWRAGSPEEFTRRLRHFTASILLTISALCALAVVAIFPALTLAGKEAYRAGLTQYWWLLAATWVGALGAVPHFALYARGNDGALLAGAVAGLLVVVAADLVLVPRLGAAGAAQGLLLGVLASGLFELWRFWREPPRLPAHPPPDAAPEPP